MEGETQLVYNGMRNTTEAIKATVKGRMQQKLQWKEKQLKLQQK